MANAGWPSTPYDKLRSALSAATPVDWVLLAAGAAVLVVSFLPWYNITVTIDSPFHNFDNFPDRFGEPGDFAGKHAYAADGWSGMSKLIPLLALATLGVRLFHLYRGGPGIRSAVVCLVLAGLATVGAVLVLMQPVNANVPAELSELAKISAERAIGLFLIPIVAAAEALVAALILMRERRLEALPAQQPQY